MGVGTVTSIDGNILWSALVRDSLHISALQYCVSIRTTKIVVHRERSDSGNYVKEHRCAYPL